MYGGVTASQVNNISVQPTVLLWYCNYIFGLSILHSWICRFTYLLYISYRLDIRRGKPEIGKIISRKEEFKGRFGSEIEVLVDMPNFGSANTNDGNPARHFFPSPSRSSAIVDVKEELMKRFTTILHATSSEYQINMSTFGTYAKQVTKLYMQCYSWHLTTVTGHRILTRYQTSIYLNPEYQSCTKKQRSHIFKKICSWSFIVYVAH
jgi:hypothetical protein